jgi:hypothetical protein
MDETYHIVRLVPRRRDYKLCALLKKEDGEVSYVWGVRGHPSEDLPGKLGIDVAKLHLGVFAPSRFFGNDVDYEPRNLILENLNYEIPCDELYVTINGHINGVHDIQTLDNHSVTEFVKKIITFWGYKPSTEIFEDNYKTHVGMKQTFDPIINVFDRE